MTNEERETEVTRIVDEMKNLETKHLENCIIELLDSGFDPAQLKLQTYQHQPNRTDLVCCDVVVARSEFSWVGNRLDYDLTPYPEGKPKSCHQSHAQPF